MAAGGKYLWKEVETERVKADSTTPCNSSLNVKSLIYYMQVNIEDVRFWETHIVPGLQNLELIKHYFGPWS